MDSVPVKAASGMISNKTMRSRSAPIIRGRRRRRSTHAPTNSPKNSIGNEDAATSSDISAGLAFRIKIAMRGRPSRVIRDMNAAGFELVSVRPNLPLLERCRELLRTHALTRLAEPWPYYLCRKPGPVR